MDQYLPAVFASLALYFPMWLVWIGAVIIAVQRRHKHPQVSRFLLGGLAVFLALQVAGSLINVALPIVLIEQGRSATEIGVVVSSVGLALSFVSAAAWVLVLMAVFRWRDDQPDKRKIEDLLDEEF